MRKKGTMLDSMGVVFWFILAIILGTIIFLVITRGQIPGLENAVDGVMKAIGLG